MKKEIDPARLEQILASGGTAKTVCAAFGISDGLFYQRMNREPELRAAFERGMIASGRKVRAKSEKTAPAVTPRKAQRVAPEEQAILTAIHVGVRSREGIRDRVGLTAGRLDACLYNLEFESRLIREEEDGYYLRGEEGPKREAPPKTEQPADVEQQEETKALARTNGNKKLRPRDVKPRIQKRVKHAPAETPVEVMPPDHRDAMEAAFVELSFVRYWNAPSNKCDETIRKLVGAMTDDCTHTAVQTKGYEYITSKGEELEAKEATDNG